MMPLQTPASVASLTVKYYDRLEYACSHAYALTTCQARNSGVGVV